MMLLPRSVDINEPKRGVLSMLELLFLSSGTIFSSKCSIAIDEISRNSCSNSLERGGH